MNKCAFMATVSSNCSELMAPSVMGAATTVEQRPDSKAKETSEGEDGKQGIKSLGNEMNE